MDTALNVVMSIRTEFGRASRNTRLRLDLTQQAVAAAARISRGYLARVESGCANPSLALMERLAEVLGLRLELTATPPIFLTERRSHDLVHARCSGAVDRRLTAAGWVVEREVDVSEGRVHGWIDLLAFHARTATLVIVEVKTRLDDVGAMERQMSWCERHAWPAARRLHWVPRNASAWLVALWSEEVERAIAANPETFAAFPRRADEMLSAVRGMPIAGRGLALLDPRSHRSNWLVRTRLDGRRSSAPYRGYAAAADALIARSPPRPPRTSGT